MRTPLAPASRPAPAPAVASRARVQTRTPAALSGALLAVSAALGIASLALAATPQAPAGAPAAPAARKPEPISESLPGVVVDWQRGQILAPGSCAADLYAASADVARTKAERMARLRAEDRLRKALALLGKDKEHKKRLAALGAPAQLSELDPARAQVAAIDYGANGSVSLRLALDLHPAPAPAAADAGTPADAGTAPPDAGVPAPVPAPAPTPPASAAPSAQGTDGR